MKILEEQGITEEARTYRRQQSGRAICRSRDRIFVVGGIPLCLGCLRDEELHWLPRSVISEDSSSQQEVRTRYRYIVWTSFVTIAVHGRLAKKEWTVCRSKIPEDQFEYAFKWIHCKHGCFDGAHGKGVRQHLHYQFTDCRGRLKAFVKKKPDGQFVVTIENEVRKCYASVYCIQHLTRVMQESLHNHLLNRTIYDMYHSGEIISDEILFGQVDALRSAGASVKAITQFVASKTGTSS